jgi:murein DD-endopeptidase MepM/ murein hydrolase activator NlpD
MTSRPAWLQRVLFVSAAGLVIVPARWLAAPQAAQVLDAATTARVLQDLRHRDLKVPVDGVSEHDLRDTFGAPRTGEPPHDAIDILAPRGTAVLAVEGGTIEKLFTSVRGGLTIYEFDPTRTYAYYYAHLDRYAPRLVEHAVVRRGALIGFVGTTGNAPKDTPHLHFSIFVLTPAKHWWQGTAIDPYNVWRG